MKDDISKALLSDQHRRELVEESAIDPAVIAERGYRTVSRPTNTDQRPREELRALGFPSWATREDYYYPGLHIPQYTPRGQRYAGQFKPFRPVPNRDGKKMKYASAKGASRLDVHPRWSADRGQHDAAAVPAIQDPVLPLWVTEGVKKADALTSRGCVTVALTGVYNWRNTHAALGDWEDVRLRGREIWICFDADAVAKPAVQRAMERLGRWLRSQGAAKVWYVVVPPGVNGSGVKGVDDYFAAGGTLKDLEKEAKDKPPRITDTSDRFTDAALAETLASEVLDGAYLWAAGMDWMAWDGRRWREAHEVTVIEAVRAWAKEQFANAAAKIKDLDSEGAAEVDGWRPMLSASRIKAVLSLARGIVERRPEDFDSDPDLINTPDGVVNLMTGDVFQHDPDLLMTKLTSGTYRPGFSHPDWDRALTVLPEDVVAWFQVRVGQAITGHTTTDGIMAVLQGGGENGKSLLTTDGLLPALGGYGTAASGKLFEKGQHSTEQAELRGKRFVIAEELAQGHSIDVAAMKRVTDVTTITARRTHKDNMTFDASHTLFATTNYVPVIKETDHGTWRRLALVCFPFTFVKPGKPITDPKRERRGDPTLKGRIKANESGQHDAAVTWAVEGAIRFYASQEAIQRAERAGEPLPPSAMAVPPTVEADTLRWRMEADRILGFWSEVIEPDPNSAVLVSELHETFNAWLKTNGHHAWSRETFGPAFADHMETKRHQVTQARTRNVGAIVRPPRSASPWLVADGVQQALPKIPRVWVGIRYRLS